jgi:hypothetical protein
MEIVKCFDRLTTWIDLQWLAAYLSVEVYFNKQGPLSILNTFFILTELKPQPYKKIEGLEHIDK